MATEFIEISEEEYQGGAGDFIEITEEEFNAPVEEPDQPFFALEDAVSAIGTIPEALSVGVPAAFQKLVTGTAMPEESEAIEKDIAFQERMRQEQQDRQAAGKSSMVGEAIREAAPSIATSFGGLGAGIAGAVGGTVVGGPVGATVGGMAASGTASYRMAAADLLYRSFKALEEQKGSPLTEEEKAQAYKEFLPLAQNSALWEAGPEAVSNAVLLGAGKFVFGFGKPLARKLVGESIERVNKGIASKVAAGVGATATELGTETITAVGQFPAQAKAEQFVKTGTTEGAPTEYPGGAMQAFKDVAPATLALTGMMAGAGGVAKAATLPFQKAKTPEQIAEDNINLDADREADNLLIPDNDTESKSIKSQIDTERADLALKKELYNTLPDGDKTKAVLATEIKEYEGRITELDNTLRQRLGLSLPITTAEQQQIELAKQIAAPAEEVAPVAEVVTPAAEAPAVEAAPVEPAPPVTEAPAITPAPTPTEPATTEDIIGKKVTDSMGALPQKAGKARQALQGYIPVFKIGDFYEFIGEDAALSGSTIVGSGKSARSSLPYHQTSKFQEIANKTGKPIAIISNTKVSEVINPITPVPVTEVAPVVSEKPLLPKKKTKTGVTTYDFTPRPALPVEKQLPRETIIANAQKVFEGVPAESIEIVNEPAPEGEYGYVAAYNPNTNKIEINQAHYSPEENIEDSISHELGHYIYQDARWKKAFSRLYKRLTKKSRQKLDSFIQQVYSDYESGDKNEESQIRAFDKFLNDAPDNRNIFQKFIDEILDFVTDSLSVFSPYFKSLARNPRRLASNIAVVAAERFKSGEVIEGVDTEVQQEVKRMAAAQPAPEKPAEEKPAEPEKPKERGTIARMAITAYKTTPKGILAKTTQIIKDSVFDGDSEVSDSATKRAWNLINSLVATNEKSIANAEAINQLTREAMTEVKAPEGATTEEAKTFEVVKQTVGMPKLRNELFKYAIKLTGQGDKRMLEFLLNNELNLAGNSIKTKEDIGRFLGALRGISSYIITATEAEQAGFFNIAAQQFFDTKNPTDEQVQQIKDIFNKVKEVKIDQEKELMTELEEVGKAAGVDLPAAVDKQLENTPGLDPMVVAMTAMQKLYGGTITTQYEPISKRAQGRFEGVKKIIQGGISNYRQKIVSKAANGLETGFWKTLSSTEQKPGPLGELDSAQNKNLGNIVKSALVAMGLKGTPPDTKMSIYEQVASMLNEQPLSQDKIKMADEKIRGAIESKRTNELENATEDQKDAINLKYDQITLAWDDAMSRMLDMPVSETMLRRMILNELKESDSSIADLATLMDEEPVIGTSRQDRLVNSIIEKVTGVTFDGQPTRDYTNLKTYLSNLLENMVRSRQEKNKAAKAVAKVRKEAAGTIESQAEKAENTAVAQIERFAKIQSDTLAWPKKGEIDPVLEAIRRALKLDSTKTKDFVNNWKPGFINELKNLGVKDASASILASVVGRQIEVNSMNKQLKLQQNEVELQTQRIQNEAKAEVEKLAKVQSDTLSFPEKKAMSGIRAAVRAALSLQLNLGFTPEQTAKIKANWKGAFVADPNKKGIPTSFMLEMQRLGVEEPVANTLSDIVWRQIEVNAMSRQMDATTKAVEAGPIGGIVQAILDTPLANQQDPEWRKNVIIDYLKNAGVKPSQAENIAKLFDVSLRKRFAKAQEEAAIKAAKSIKGGLTANSKRALEKFLKAIRAQVLDPGKDVAKAFAEEMGWKGFTSEQIVKLNELDAIVNDDEKTDAEKAVATEQIQKIIDKVSMPPQIKEVLSSFYIGNALMRFTTFAVQAFDPLAMTTFNTAIESFRNITNPQQFIQTWADYGRAVSNLFRETAFSYKNDVLRSGKMIDYLDNQDRKIKRLADESVRKFKAGDIRGAMKDGIFGYTAWTFRTLKALDDGAYSLLTSTTLPQYVEAALKNAKIPREKRRGVMRQVLHAREMDIEQMVSKGIPKNDAVIYANERMQAAITKELSGLNIDAQEVINSAINDALARIGKTRFAEDILTGKTEEIKDLGTISAPFLRWYESVSKAVSGKGSESQKIFYRILLGFPLIPARIFNIAAGYTPLTIYRHALKSRYSLTYGTALQRRQRLAEQLAGTMVLLPLLALRSNSTDEEDEKEKGFGVYITGQGPSKMKDKTLHAKWNDRHDPFSLEFRMGGKTKFSIDAKAAGPLSVMIYLLGAMDDWETNRRLDGLKTSKDDWKEAQDKASILTSLYELAGYATLTTARRGPTTGVMQGLVDFRRFPDDPIAAIGADVSFSAMPAVPILGTGIAKNLSDFFSQPIDNTTKEGAILSNIPIVGPIAGKPALNSYGQRLGELRVSEKLKKSFGVPFTLVVSDNEEDNKLTSLTLKFGDGPTPLRREDVENELKSAISDDEWYLAAKTFGDRNRSYVLKNYNRYEKMKPAGFSKVMSALGKASKANAISAVKKARRNNP